MSNEGDYDLGYFEGVRNVFMLYVRSNGDEEAFLEGLKTELRLSKQLRDRWDEDGH